MFALIVMSTWLSAAMPTPWPRSRDAWVAPCNRRRVQPSQAVLRHADPQRDAAACAAIYAPYVRDSPVSFEEERPGVMEMARRIERTSRTHPWLVYEREGDVAGYAYATPHRDRAAYRWATDVSVYVHPEQRRAGIGRALYLELFELLRAQRLRIAVAGITLPNEASVALHESLGFVPVGVYRDIGWKAGGWRDVGWWQLDLQPQASGGPPSEPLGPQRLPPT
jgi:L-amino acid N-acyltransferase YncA